MRYWMFSECFSECWDTISDFFLNDASISSMSNEQIDWILSKGVVGSNMFLFLTLPAEMIQMGWNHQPVYSIYTYFSSLSTPQKICWFQTHEYCSSRLRIAQPVCGIWHSGWTYFNTLVGRQGVTSRCYINPCVCRVWHCATNSSIPREI